MSSKIIRSSGALFFCSTTRRYLFLLRDNHRYANTWCFPGGKVLRKETEFEGVMREIEEELGVTPASLAADRNSWRVIPIEKFTSENGKFEYHTFVFIVNAEFMPTLNDEHRGYCWTSLDGWPKPLHPGVFGTLQEDVIKDKLRVIEEMN